MLVSVVGGVDTGGEVAVGGAAASAPAPVVPSPTVPITLEGCNEVRAGRVPMCICLRKGKRQIATWNTDE